MGDSSDALSDLLKLHQNDLVGDVLLLLLNVVLHNPLTRRHLVLHHFAFESIQTLLQLLLSATK